MALDKLHAYMALHWLCSALRCAYQQTLCPAQETDAVGKQKAQERFQRLKTAYDVLKDPQTRKDYDSGRMAASG